MRSAPFWNLVVPQAKLTVSEIQKDGETVRFTVSSDTFAHVVHFGMDDRLRFSDEYFDLLPGESREIVLYEVLDWSKGGNIDAKFIAVFKS